MDFKAVSFLQGSRPALTRLILGAAALAAAGSAPAHSTVLYSFKSGSDGAQPVAGVIFNDSEGALFGTTFVGGTSSIGTVFKLKLTSPQKEKVLYSFMNGNDGNTPRASVIFDSKGVLYGTTLLGGTRGLRHGVQNDPAGPSSDAMDRDGAAQLQERE
ncbi:MAG: choice-of-anchor tandem repeat GloVer-containing protein [Methylocella sp.]